MRRRKPSTTQTAMMIVRVCGSIPSEGPSVDGAAVLLGVSVGVLLVGLVVSLALVILARLLEASLMSDSFAELTDADTADRMLDAAVVRAD